MFKVIIEIDVENSSEVAKREMGKLLGPAINFMPSSLIKSKVEDAVKSEVIKTLDEGIREKFNERGIKAKIDIK